MIRRMPFPQSAALQRELEAHRKSMPTCSVEKIRGWYPTREDFCRNYVNSAECRQLAAVLRDLAPGASLLDIGAGYGIIAIYLASQGYRVTAAEPSPELCDYIDNAARLYGLTLDVCNVSAEYLHQLVAASFDACLFNASLHHCDDPAQALANCHALLRPGGKVALLNEPLLQFFRSKAWFNRQLDTGQLLVGDYGGNEHIYYYHEYRALLARAGFSDISDFVAFRYRHPASYFRVLHSEKARSISFLVRRLYYSAIAGLLHLGLVGRPAVGLLKRLSLLQTNFVAMKPQAYNLQEKKAARAA